MKGLRPRVVTLWLNKKKPRDQIDLIYEGITTLAPMPRFSTILPVDQIDLIYEGITTPATGGVLGAWTCPGPNWPDLWRDYDLPGALFD